MCCRTLARLAIVTVLATLCLMVPAVLLPGATPARAAQTPCGAPVTLANGDFEAPGIAAASMSLIAQGNMPGWKTTAPDKVFELWREVRQTFNAGSGSQFVELNANYVSQLYQDLPTADGVTLRWELKHRGRLGTDTMAVKIGPPGGTLIQQGAQISDGSTAWGTYSGIYTVPNGQSTTRFAFDSISTAQNMPTHGNFLDGISFGTAACLLTTTSVRNSSGNATANVGDVLTYTVAAENKGGNPAKLAVLTDGLPAGTTFVPGSIRAITGLNSATLSDGADSDTGEYDSAARRVRVRVGAGAASAAGGSVPVGETRSFSYQARVTSAAATSTLGNDASASYRDDLTDATRTATSNTVNTTVNSAVDLAISATVAAPGVIAGQGVTAVVTVVNNGPDTATTVQANALVPFGIVGIGAGSPQGTCSVSGYLATCDIPSLAAGASATMNVTGTVIPMATPAAQATLTVAVGSATYEINQVDNATSVSAAVATVADLDVTMAYAPALPVAGTTVTYTATVTNNGPSTARDIVLIDPIATGATFVSASTAGGTCALAAATRTVECTLPNTDPGLTRTVTIVVQLDPGGTGAVNNAVSVSASTPESDVTDNNFSVQSAGTAVADMGVQLTIGATTAKPGETVPFTLTVTNHGPSVATNVSFNTIVPVGFTVVRPASPYCTSTACTFPALPPGAVVRISGTAQIGANAAAGVQSASTTVISPTTDLTPGNDTSVVTFTIELEADLGVTQTLGNATSPSDPLIAGHDVKGAVTVTNDGPTRAEGVVLRQAVPAGRPIPVAVPSTGACAFQGSGSPGGLTTDGGIYVCTRATMASAATWQIDFTGVPLPAGYSSTAYTRTAAVSAATPDPHGSDDSVTTTRPVEHRSDLAVTKTVNPSSVVQTASASFEITVTNAGPSEATGVLVREDPEAGLVLDSGVPTLGTFDTTGSTWTIPQLDVGGPGARLELTATAQGTGTLTAWTRIIASDSIDPVPGDNAASAVVTAAAAAPRLDLRVTTTLSSGSLIGAAAGDTIGYAYQVTNTGNLAMSGLVVAGTRGGTGTCLTTTLAPAASTTCTATGYPVVSGDVAAGMPISDVVTASAETAAAVGPVPFAQVTASVPVVVADAALTAVVTATVSPASRQNAAAAGDVISYRYAVTNNGNVDMRDIVLSDPAAGGITCPATTLALGVSMVCTTASGAGYEVTPADLNTGGAIVDALTVTGRKDSLSPTLSFGTFGDSVTLAAPAPRLRLTVTPSTSAPVRVGDPIGYAYRVANTGNVTVTGLTLSDTKISGIVCPGTVAAGADVTCNPAPGQAYLVTQADVDAGATVQNDAVVSGLSIAPGATAASAEGGAAVPVIAAAPALAITVTSEVFPVARQTGVVLGDRIGATYRVRNSGNVTMTDIAVSGGLAGAPTCPGATLAVGAQMTCGSGVYSVNQQDVDGGWLITGTVLVRGRAPGQTTAAITASAPISVPVASGTPMLNIVGWAAVTPPEHRTAVEAGDRIGYEYLVTNSGTLTMREVTVEETLLGVAVCPAGALAPGGTAVCTSRQTYTVTEADVDAGGALANEASVSGRAPNTSQSTFGPIRIDLDVSMPEPVLRVRTTAAVTPAAHQFAVEAGDTITYTQEVANAGDRPLTGITVRSARLGAVTCPQDALAVRESMTCTAMTYAVTQADVEAGSAIGDDVTLTGGLPGEAGSRTFGPFPVSVGLAEPKPVLNLAMVAEVALPDGTAPAGDAFVAGLAVTLGDAIRFGYRVTNAGNVAIRRLTVDDTRAGAVTCVDTVLAIGASTTCAADELYRVTQDDVDSGAFIAEAHARGVYGAGDRVAASGKAQAPVTVSEPRPGLAAQQRSQWTDTDGDHKLSIHDEVISTVRVTNTGNVTLVRLRVTGLPAPVTCAATRISPGDEATCVSGGYHLTAEEVARGRQTFRARVVADLMGIAAPEVEVTAPSTVVVPADDPATAPPPAPSPPPGPALPSPALPGSVPVTGGSSALVVAGLSLITGGVSLLLLTRAPARARPAPAVAVTRRRAASPRSAARGR